MTVVCVVVLVSISKFAEIIYYVGISINHSRKFRGLIPDASVRGIRRIDSGQRSTFLQVTRCHSLVGLSPRTRPKRTSAPVSRDDNKNTIRCQPDSNLSASISYHKNLTYTFTIFHWSLIFLLKSTFTSLSLFLHGNAFTRLPCVGIFNVTPMGKTVVPILLCTWKQWAHVGIVVRPPRQNHTRLVVGCLRRTCCRLDLHLFLCGCRTCAGAARGRRCCLGAAGQWPCRIVGCSPAGLASWPGWKLGSWWVHEWPRTRHQSLWGSCCTTQLTHPCQPQPCHSHVARPGQPFGWQAQLLPTNTPWRSYCLVDRQGLVLAHDPILVLFGIHPAALDDSQANVNDITTLYRVSCRACVGCADEEACCKGLEAFGGMPLGGYLLPICFAIFNHGFLVKTWFPLFVNEPTKHVKENRVWVLHPNWVIHFANYLEKICKKNIGDGQIHCNNISSCFFGCGCGLLLGSFVCCWRCRLRSLRWRQPQLETIKNLKGRYCLWRKNRDLVTRHRIICS